MSQDFRDLLAEFNDHGVEFVIVGAHALAVHGCVRATKDLDVWIRPEPENAKRAIAALRKFGAPLHDLTENDLSSPGTTFQIGLPPLRIDILTAITGVDFEEAWRGRIQTRFVDQSVAVLSKEHLLDSHFASDENFVLVSTAERCSEFSQVWSATRDTPGKC